jgi:hypothetical protein
MANRREALFPPPTWLLLEGSNLRDFVGGERDGSAALARQVVDQREEDAALAVRARVAKLVVNRTDAGGKADDHSGKRTRCG